MPKRKFYMASYSFTLANKSLQVSFLLSGNDFPYFSELLPMRLLRISGRLKEATLDLLLYMRLIRLEDLML